MNIDQWLKKYEEYFWKVRQAQTGKGRNDGSPGSNAQELYGNTAATLVTNQMQAEMQKHEAEKAYNRSRATTQVADMMSAGMSRAGALNAINGGGSYTPAPIQLDSPAPGSDAANVRQQNMQTAEMALSGFNNMLSNVQQFQTLKMQREQFDKTLNEQKRQFNESIQLERDKFQEAANQNAALRNVWENEREYRDAQRRNIEIKNEIDSALKSNYIDKEKANYLAEIAKAQLEEIRSKTIKQGYDNLTNAQFKALIEYQVALEIMGNFGNMTTTQIISHLHDIIDSLPFL